MTFSQTYLAVGDKVVEKLQAEAAVSGGGFLDGIVKPENIHWGTPLKNKRDEYEDEFELYVMPGNTDLFENTTSSYSVPQLVHVLIFGHSDEVDDAIRLGLQIQGLIVETFTAKKNEDLDNTIRVIHNPKGGADFSLTDTSFAPTGVKAMRQFYVWLSVSFYCHFIQPIN